MARVDARRARVLSVLPHAGGNVAPTVQLLVELAARGGQVEVLGHEQLRDVVSATGLDFRPFAHARPWNATVANPGLRSMLGYLRLASDRGLGMDVAAAVADREADVIIVDCMVPAALRSARASGAAVVMVMHTLSSYWTRSGRLGRRSVRGFG